MIFGQYSSRNQRAKGLKVKHVFKIALLLAFCVWLIYQIRNSHEKRKTDVEGIQNTLNGGDGNLDFGRKMKFEFTDGMRNNSDDRNSDQIIGNEGAEDDELHQKTEEKTEEENLNREHEESQGIGVHPGKGTLGNEQYTQEESQNNEEKNIDDVGKKEDDTPQEERQNDVEDSSNNQMKDTEEDAKESRTREPNLHIPEGEKEFESQEEGSEERKREQDSPQKKELQSNEKYNSKDGSEEEAPQENEQDSNEEDISDNKFATAEEGERELENQQAEVTSDQEEDSDVRILNEEGKNEQETINETIVNWEEEKPESDKTKDLNKNTSEAKDRRMEENWYESTETKSQTNCPIRDIIINNGGNFSVLLNESRGETQVSNSKVENISRSDNQAEPDESTTFREEEISNRSLADTSTHNQALDEAVGNQEVNETAIDETTAATHLDSNSDPRVDGEVTLKSAVQTSAESNTDILEGQVSIGRMFPVMKLNEKSEVGNNEGGSRYDSVFLA
ncbi:chromatin modification-related protein EAF7-like [Aristolochia californica]|uniref:chromatin modification-related protein EAF7-like n=1 Tax=Aristolochia californica TaxID=171875 RepID=UPI0035D91056